MNGYLYVVKYFDWNLLFGNKVCVCYLGYGNIRYIKELVVFLVWWILIFIIYSNISFMWYLDII